MTDPDDPVVRFPAGPRVGAHGVNTGRFAAPAPS